MDFWNMTKKDCFQCVMCDTTIQRQDKLQRRIMFRRSASNGLRAVKRWGGARGVHTEERLQKMGIELPIPRTPEASFVLTVRTGNLLYTAGHIPIKPDGTITTGKVGQELNEADAIEAARNVAIQLMGTIKRDLGDLDRVKRVVKLLGFVNCVDGFTAQPKVVNGASDLFAEVFQEKGVHARSAVGTNALPRNVPVEIEAIIEIEEE